MSMESAERCFCHSDQIQLLAIRGHENECTAWSFAQIFGIEEEQIQHVRSC